MADSMTAERRAKRIGQQAYGERNAVYIVALEELHAAEAAAYERGRADENEACAVVAEEHYLAEEFYPSAPAIVIAQRIRARLASSAEDTSDG